MDILQLLKDRSSSQGLVATSKDLQLPPGLVSQYIDGKKSPGYGTCQKIVNLWGNGHSKKSSEENSDGSDMKISVDEDGCLNLSYTPPEWGKKKAKWEGRDVCICIPIYKPIPYETYFTHMAMAMKYKQGMMLEARGRDSMIARSRNHLAKRFYNSGATWSIWFDSDMAFPMGHAGIYSTLTGMKNLPENLASLNTIERLISHGKTMMGGCYWDRNGSGKLIAGGMPIMAPIPSDRIIPMGFVGTGCLAVHRQVYVDILAKFPEVLSADSLGNESGFFTPIQTPQRMLGEDESFAKRATDSGHPTYLDLGLICGHVGEAIHGIPPGGSKI